MFLGPKFLIDCLFVLGTKHKKMVHKCSSSQDPEVQKKVEVAKKLAQDVKHHLLQNSKTSVASPPPGAGDGASRTAPQGALSPSKGDDMNLPPGYVFIPATQSGTGKDSYLCSTCQHYSHDLFSLSAVRP